MMSDRVLLESNDQLTIYTISPEFQENSCLEVGLGTLSKGKVRII